MGCAKQSTITPKQNEKEIKELKARIEKLEQLVSILCALK
jgi:hypothetical protein